MRCMCFLNETKKKKKLFFCKFKLKFKIFFLFIFFYNNNVCTCIINTQLTKKKVDCVFLVELFYLELKIFDLICSSMNFL